MSYLIGLDHLQIAIPRGEEAAARHFYGEVLGLTEIPKPEPLVGRGGCWFEGQGIQIHLGVEAEFQPAKKAHPAFLVRNLEELRTHLAAANVRITSDDTLPDVRRFYAADPFGNRLEFIQQADGFRHT